MSDWVTCRECGRRFKRETGIWIDEIALCSKACERSFVEHHPDEVKRAERSSIIKGTFVWIFILVVVYMLVDPSSSIGKLLGTILDGLAVVIEFCWKIVESIFDWVVSLF